MALEDAKQQFLNDLKANLLEAEFLLAAFSTAASSYKSESLVKPFPPMFVAGTGEKDVASLVRGSWFIC